MPWRPGPAAPGLSCSVPLLVWPVAAFPFWLQQHWGPAGSQSPGQRWVAQGRHSQPPRKDSRQKRAVLVEHANPPPSAEAGTETSRGPFQPCFSLIICQPCQEPLQEVTSPGPVLTCSAEAAFSLQPQGSEEQPLSHLVLLHQLPGTGEAAVTWLL